MRIGINVPDDLLKRLEPLKAVTNISVICRNAIRTHVDAYERAMKRAKEDGVHSIAERLGSMIVPQQVDWEMLGIEDAKMWVQLAKLEDFESLIGRIEASKKQDRSPYEVRIPHVQGVKFFENHSSEPKYDEWFDKQIEADEEINPYVQAKLEYQRGKISYILYVWNMAREVSRKRFKQESLAREKAKKEAKNGTEIPKHLLNELK